MTGKDLARRTELNVLFNNVDISEDINKDLISLTYTDAKDGETDDLKITVADRENKWTQKWLRKEMENRPEANAMIANGLVDFAEDTGEAIGDGAGTYTVTAKIGLNVRSGPGTGYNRIGGISYGTQVQVVSTENGWARLNYSGTEAYVSTSYLRKDADWDEETMQMDGSGQSHGKFTKIQATITAKNWDGDGGERSIRCGTFELDSVKVSGPPQVVTMSATSLSYESSIRNTEKTRSWNESSLSGILSEIAGSGGYQSYFNSGYDPKYQYMIQNGLTDAAFLKRLAEKAGLSLKISDGTMAVYDPAELEGSAAVRVIERGDGSYSSYDFDSDLAMTAYSSCHVSYEDDQGNTYEATYTPPTGYPEGEVLEVTEQVSSNAEAYELAVRRLRKENKGEMTGNFKMPGDPRLMSGMNIEVKGWGDFDGKWSIEEASHSVSKSGYETSIKIAKIVEGY